MKKDIDQCKVWCGYIKTAIFCIVFGGISLYIAECVNHHVTISHLWLQISRLMGIIPGAIGVYGIRGWDIQTCSGNTPAEITNRHIYKTLMAIGFVFGIFCLGLEEHAL